MIRVGRRQAGRMARRESSESRADSCKRRMEAGRSSEITVPRVNGFSLRRF